jgi:mediator of RNA polymerase II transcription subunit 12, fungi type
MTGLLSDTENEAEALRRVGEMLRVLVHVSQPFRGPTATLPSVDTATQEAFIDTLDKRLKVLDSQVANKDTSTHSPQDFILPCRLLQFILSFRITWTPKMKDSSSNLSAMIFRLALVSLHRLKRSRSI